MDFKVINSNKYYLKVPNATKRFVHIASISLPRPNKISREFLLFVDKLTTNFYCEELINGQLHQIQNDNLFTDIMSFVQSKGLLTVSIDQDLEKNPLIAPRSK